MSSTEMAPPPRHKPRPPSRSNSTASSRHLGTRQRYCVLESGILKYAKTQQDGKSQEVFSAWVSSLRAHRIIRKSDSTRLQNGVYTVLSTLKPLPSNGALLGLVDSKVAAWLQHTDDMQTCSRELSECQTSLTELWRLLQSLEVLHRVASVPLICDSQNSVSEKPKKEKRSSKIWCTKNSAKEEAAGTPESSQLQQDFCSLAQRVHSSLKSAFDSLSLERERLQQSWLQPQQRETPVTQMANLRNALSEVQTPSDPS
ncbi:UNVERIFIED_CONTAM: hypothetical protein FKN15_069449 [Acipenser sinensis]